VKISHYVLEKKMFRVTAKAHFDSAHFLKGYDGKCANIHGHRWTVEAEVSGGLIAFGEEKQMVVDFGRLREALEEIADFFDHSLIYEDGSLGAVTVDALESEGFSLCPVDFRPTAESFAYHFYNELKDNDFDISRVTVWETPDSSATYIPEPETDLTDDEDFEF
jgi:6-pyruvoyltetrahydropterin/6-carboxytetrahydropterin synthase